MRVVEGGCEGDAILSATSETHCLSLLSDIAPPLFIWMHPILQPLAVVRGSLV